MFTQDQIRQSMRLYAVTDRSYIKEHTLVECVEAVLRGGATCIQLREKEIDAAEFEKLARDIMPLCRQAQVPFIINDDVELARLVGADGVHVGQEDMACENARELLGESAIIGVSVQTLEQALIAWNAGADYLGVGAMFGTPTKPEAAEVSIETLTEICKAVDIPVVAIGGLNSETTGELACTGVDGIAVVSALFAADDIQKATENLLRLVDEMLAFK